MNNRIQLVVLQSDRVGTVPGSAKWDHIHDVLWQVAGLNR